MFAGRDYSKIYDSTPRSIELNYTGTTWVNVGEFSDYDISIDDVSTPGDPHGALRVQYYRISMKFECVQTGTGELSVLTDSGQLNVPAGIRVTYPWGTFTIARTSFEFRPVAAYSGSSDEGAMVLRFRADLIATPSQLSGMISYT